MIDQTFHGKSRPYTRQSVLSSLAQGLGEVKLQDRLTFDDMAAVLGKCSDQVAKYYEGTALMDAETLGRGRKEWGSRFTGYYDRLCGEVCHAITGRQAEGKVLTAALALSVALADDNEVSDREIRANRSSIEDARDALDALLARVPA